MKNILLIVILLLFAFPLYAADTEVQDLADITSPASSDDMYIVDDPDVTPISRKISVSALLGVATDLEAGGALSANTVDSSELVTGSVDLEHMSSQSVDSDNIVEGTIVDADNANDALDPDKLVGDDVDDNLIDHEIGGLQADVSGVSGLIAISGGSTLEVDAKSELETQIADVADFAEADGDVYTGTHDFGGADDLEIPNSATPTVDTAGQVAMDTTITDHDGLIYYYQGAEIMVIPAIPLADLTTNDGDVIDYNAAGNKFTMAAPAAGGETNSLEVVTTGIATTEIPIGTDVDTVVYSALSGDVTMDNAGAVSVNSVQANSVDSAAYVDGSIDLAHMSSQSVDSDNIVEDTIVDADINSAAAITISKTALTAGRSLTLSTNDVLADVELYTYTKCIIIETPTSADNFIMYHVELGAQVISAHGIVEDATSATVQLLQCDFAGDNCTEITSPIVCDVGGQADDGVIDAPDLDIDDWIRANVTATDGTPGVVTVCITFTMDD